MPSVVKSAANRVLRDVEPGGAVRESEVHNLHADAVRDRLTKGAVGVIEERGHALAHAVRRRCAEVPDDVAMSPYQSMNFATRSRVRVPT